MLIDNHIREMSRENAQEFLHMIAPWQIADKMDAFGDLAEGYFCVGYVENNELRAYLIGHETQDTLWIDFLDFHKGVQQKAAAALFIYALCKARIDEVEFIDYSFMEEEKYQMAEYLNNIRFQVEKELCIYRIYGEGFQAPKEYAEKYAEEIYPLLEVPFSAVTAFLDRIGEEIPAFLDFTQTENIAWDLSVGAYVDGKLVGYVACVVHPTSIEVRQAYVDDSMRHLFAPMIARVAKAYKEKYEAISQINIAAADELTEKLVEKLFEGRILLKQPYYHAYRRTNAGVVDQYHA